MLLIAIYADFPIEKTGVYSTAKSIMSNYDEDFIVFSNQNISFLDKEVLDLREIYNYNNKKILSFTHIECSLIMDVYKRFPESYFHVGDWPVNYMNSVIQNGNKFRGYLGVFKIYFKLIRLKKDIKLIFVNSIDTQGANSYGFYNSCTINIGVNLPSIEINEAINTNLFCFTGNFRYEPNKLAALELINIFKKMNNSNILMLAGFYASDFAKFESRNIEIYDNVPNMLNFLAEKRPIYISPIRLGAGSKNKILEALVSGCPVYASKESLDDTLFNIDLIGDYEYIKRNNFSIDTINVKDYNNLALSIREDRSWGKIANYIKEILI